MLFSLVVCVVILALVGRKGTGELLSPLASSLPTPTPLPSATPTFSIRRPTLRPTREMLGSGVASLETEMERVLESQTDKEWSIVLSDMQGNSIFQKGQSAPYHAASVAKLVTALYVLKQIQDGTLSQHIPLGSFSLDYQLQQMVNQSNNDAWDALNSTVGLRKQQAFAGSIGLSQFDIYTNTMSAKEAALLLRTIYKGSILEEEERKELLSLMTHTNDERFIPAGVGAGYTVYHKTGFYEGNAHDAAIVEGKKKPFVLVIFSKGEYEDYEKRITVFHTISKIAREFMDR